MPCPVCKGNAVGKVGSNQFYCWDCCIEYSFKKDKVLVYELDDEGELVPVSELDAVGSVQ